MNMDIIQFQYKARSSLKTDIKHPRHLGILNRKQQARRLLKNGLSHRHPNVMQSRQGFSLFWTNANKVVNPRIEN